MNLKDKLADPEQVISGHVVVIPSAVTAQAMVRIPSIDENEIKRALDAGAEDICAVEGVDCMVLAPFDLSTELGVPGQLDHSLMTEANARIEAAAKKAGMPLGGVAYTEEQAQDLKAKGYRILANFDVLMLKRATAQVAERARA